MYEESRPASVDIECTWHSRSTTSARYLVPAVEYWDIWFADSPATGLTATVSGPALGHRWIESVPGEYGWGVQFKAHVMMPGASKRLLLGGQQPLPVTDGTVEIHQRRFLVPDFAGLPGFVEDLLAAGVLRSDDEVCRALSGDSEGYSPRQWQRRVREVTGVTRKQVAQLERARTAFRLLQEGMTPAECAAACGYADQAHLTRSLRIFHGQTPARVLAAASP